jgi:uncharacterized protein
MASFIVVFFFAVTGITLNHAEHFGGGEHLSQRSGGVNPAWVKAGAADVDKSDIVDYLKRTERLGGALGDFRSEDAQVSVAFKGPGYAADVVIDRATGKYDLTESRLGFVAIINDLHKGRDTGSAWKWMIDLSAALLTFVSLTGLTLIYFVHKHRTSGIVLLGMGALVAWVSYALWVP